MVTRKIGLKNRTQSSYNSESRITWGCCTPNTRTHCRTICISFIAFSSWRADRIYALETESSVISTELGDIEYAVLGDGIPFLSLHGTPGGYDQMIRRHRDYPERYAGRMTIAVSRPGYLRTPLSSGESYEAQADLFAALLDELDIDRAVVYAASGGGYTGLQFALRHPERSIGLILYAPSVSYEPLEQDTREYWESGQQPEHIFREMFIWAVSEPLVRIFSPMFLEGINLSDEEQIEDASELTATLFPPERRAAGTKNDVFQRDNPAIENWPLEQIKVPTLLLHGDADENSVYAGSQYVASKIANAELITFKGGNHFVSTTRSEEVQGHINRFLDGLGLWRLNQLESIKLGEIKSGSAKGTRLM